MSNTLSVSHSHIYHMDSNTKYTYQNPVPAHSHIQYSNVHLIANNLHNHYHIISKPYHQENNSLSCMKYIIVNHSLKFNIFHNFQGRVYNFYFHLKFYNHHILHMVKRRKCMTQIIWIEICYNYMILTLIHSIDEKRDYWRML